jgi:hypothetical protein
VKHVATALALWAAVGCNESPAAGETTGLTNASVTQGDDDGTTGLPPGPSCAASDECSPGVCAAAYVDVSTPLAFECISGCIADGDATLWCKDDGSCCAAGSVCGADGYCNPGAGTSGDTSSGATTGSSDDTTTSGDVTTDDGSSTSEGSSTDDGASTDDGTSTDGTSTDGTSTTGGT